MKCCLLKFIPGTYKNQFKLMWLTSYEIIAFPDQIKFRQKSCIKHAHGYINYKKNWHNISGRR